MKVVIERPPNFKAICRVLPFVKKAKNIVFTYGDIIYAPDSYGTLPPDLMAHEARHNTQQAWDPASWWDKYLKDDKFRAQQELEAYQTQYKYARKHYARSVFQPLLKRLAQDLAGPIYGGVYTYEDAILEIRGKRK